MTDPPGTRFHGDPSAYRKQRGGSNLDPVPTPEARHCWLEGADGQLEAVLLLEWRQDAAGEWEGSVARPVPGGLAAGWMPAFILRPLYPAWNRTSEPPLAEMNERPPSDTA